MEPDVDAIQKLDVTSADRGRGDIISQGIVRSAQIEVRQRFNGWIRCSGRRSERPVAHLNRTGGIASVDVVVDQMGGYQSLSTPVTEIPRERLSLHEIIVDPPPLRQLHESVAKVETKINPLLDGRLILRQLLERAQCLLEPHHSLGVRRTLQRSASSPAVV